MALALEHSAQQHLNRRVIINDENISHGVKDRGGIGRRAKGYQPRTGPGMYIKLTHKEPHGKGARTIVPPTIALAPKLAWAKAGSLLSRSRPAPPTSLLWLSGAHRWLAFLALSALGTDRYHWWSRDILCAEASNGSIPHSIWCRFC